MKLISIITMMFVLASCSKPTIEEYKVPQLHTEDMPTLVKSSNSIQIILAEDVEGRHTYTVLFPDGTALDSMYAEEIANGLRTGVWEYNEDL